MPYGANETMKVHEILGEKIGLIDHFSLYAQQCQNQTLRQMIDLHVQTAIQSYNQLVAYTHDYSAAQQQVPPYGAPTSNPQEIQYGLRQPAPQAPNLQGTFTDQQIASAMLSCHKNSAKCHTAAALECADPHVRQMMVQGATTCTNQAYEVFLFMNQQGWYQVPTMEDQTAKTFLHTYQPVQGGQAMTQSRHPVGSTMQ